MNEIDLQSIPGCMAEIEACSRGLAAMDHLYGRVLDDLADRRVTWEAIEVDAARSARDDAPRAATATEIRAGITAYVNRTPSASKARAELAEAENRKEKLDRWMRSLEKRMSGAQSAQNGHDKLAKYGGGDAPTYGGNQR